MRWTALVVLGLLLPTEVLGEVSELERGLRHYTHGEYPQAIKALERASQTSRDPKILARASLYLGLSHAVIGDTPRAEKYFVAAMTHDPLLEPDPFRIKPDLVALYKKTRDRQRATLRVEATRSDAVVLVDGSPSGHPPLRLALPIGKHRVEVHSKDGEHKQSWELVLPPGATVQVSAQLGPLPKKPTRSKPKPEPKPEPGPHRRRLWTWIAAGGALASAAVAGGLWASVQSDLSEYDDPATPDEDALALEDPIRRKVLATNVMIGLGGALAATAVVLFFVEGRESRARVRASFGSDGRAVWLGAKARF
jgi:hypothetical protein